MSFISNWFKEQFRKKKLVYTAFGHDEYFKAVNKLVTKGVKYETKIPLDFRGRDNQSERYKQYKIFVFEEDEHKALEALHKS